MSGRSPGTARLTTASAIGPELVVHGARRDAADRATLGRLARLGLGPYLLADDLVAGRGQHRVAAVEVQQHEPPRRVAEVVHLRHRLLARGSSPCRGARRCAASRARAGSSSRRPRSRGAGARPRCAAPRAASVPATATRPARTAAAASASAARGTMRSIQCQADAGWPDGSAYWWRSGPRATPTGRSSRAATPCGRCRGRRQRRARRGTSRRSPRTRHCGRRPRRAA